MEAEEGDQVNPRPAALFFLPNHDPATRYGHYFLSQSAREASRYLLTAVLEGPDANRRGLMAAAEFYRPGLFVLLGHGGPGEFHGWGDELVMSVCSGDEVLSGAVVLALSCFTGARLGPDAVGKGALAYLGWREDFAWVASEDMDPATDPYAPAFFGPVQEMARVLYTGGTAGRAYGAYLSRMEEEVRRWSRSEDPNASLVVMVLLHDLEGAVLHGDPRASVGAPARPVARPAAAPLHALGAVALGGLMAALAGWAA